MGRCVRICVVYACIYALNMDIEAYATVYAHVCVYGYEYVGTSMYML